MNKNYIIISIGFISTCFWGFTFLRQDNTQTISADNAKIQYTGRFDFANPKQPKFAWTGSQITFTFEGTFCNLLMNNFSEGNDKTGKPNVNYFNILINNKLVSVLKVENGKNFYELAKDLPKGKYTVHIFKRTEASVGICEFIGFQIDKNGKVMDSPKKPKRKVEFIGDSITCGYGNEGDKKECPFTPETENGMMSYAAIMAQSVDAEYVTTCYSGRGVIQNYDKSKQGTMPELYDLVYPQANSPQWKFDSGTPDAVFINLGTNDFAHEIPDSTSFVLSYNSLINKIVTNYPKAKVFCLAGSMMGGEKLKTIKNYLQQTVSYQHKKGNTKVYFFEMSSQGKLGYGCDWHPNVAQNQQNAKELIAFVKEKMKW
ncbi:MAG: hypothetical protein EAZ08_01350 [Cytophagales bacterium]|nr:MAG: hypothetical protein EAZ08_01350 [Cytophagales bacterium]